MFGWGAKPAKKVDNEKELQISSLKIAFPSLRRPYNDDNVFEMRFAVDGQYNSMRITIPGDFPNSRPVIRIAGPVEHPWLDQFKEVNGGKLQHWNRIPTNLVEVVEEILSALSVGINGNNPGSGQTGQSQSERARAGSGFGDGSAIPAVPGGPRYQQPSYPQQSQQPSTGSQNSYLDIIRGSAQPAYAGNPNVNQNGLQGLEGGVQGLTLQVPNSSGKSDVQLQDDPASPAFIMPMPDVPKSFPELEKLTDLQLERMLRDEVALETKVNSIASVKEMNSLLKQLRVSNAELASKNVMMEPEISSAVKELQAVKDKFNEAYQNYTKKRDDAAKEFEKSKADVLIEIGKITDELDNETETIGQSLVDGDLDLSSFLESYINTRKRYHGLLGKKISCADVK